MIYKVLDIATASLPDAANYVDTPRPPANYKDEAKIAAYVAEKQAERIAGAGLDLDLCRITAIGQYDKGGEPLVTLCKTEAEERAALEALAPFFREANNVAVTFNGENFDLPVIVRRALWLGVKLPPINLDRYRTPHVDVAAKLSDRNPDRRRSLSFYVKRHGWTDLAKPLSGYDEAKVHETGAWSLLQDSVVHDLTATHRLAEWLGVWR